MQEQNNPGAVVAPNTNDYPAPTSPSHQTTPSVVASPVSPPQQPGGVPAVEPTQPTDSLQPNPQSYEEMQPTAMPNQEQDLVSLAEEQQEDDILLAWQASESNDHAKSSSYYVSVVGVAIVLTALTFWLTEKDFLASGAVFLAVLGFAYLASHKLTQQDYALAQGGIYIGNKARAYDEFKNFSVSKDAGGTSIVLIPHKRFGSPLILRINGEQADTIVSTLSQFLPLEQRKLDAVDLLMRRMRL